MKRLYPLLGLSLLCLSLHGQEPYFPPLPDSCFDVIVFQLPDSQTRPARKKFERQLDSLLALPHPDSIVLARVYRRLATVIFLSSGGEQVNALAFALKSLQFFENQRPRNELELAHSRLVYAYSLFGHGRYDIIEVIIKEAIQRNKIIFGEISKIQELHYRVLAMAYNNVSRYSEARIYGDQALNIARLVRSPNDIQLAKTLYNYGALLYGERNLEASLMYLSEAATIVSKTWEKEHPAIASIYHFTGNVYKDLGDIEGALAFYHKSLSISQQYDYGGNIPTLSWMAELYLETGNFEMATFLQEMAWKGYTKNHTIIAGVDRAYKMVQLYAITGDHQKEAQAFQYLTEKCGGFGTFGRIHEYAAFGYHYHALSLMKQKRNEEALHAIDYALEIREVIDPGNQRLKHESLLLKAQILTQLQRFDEATILLHTILGQSPLLDKKKQALTQLASIHFKKYQDQGQQNGLQAAWDYQMQALQVLDAMRYSYQYSASRMQQAELNFHLFESTLHTSYERQDLPTSFWVAEKSKASALLDNQRDDLARRIAGLPDSLLHRESGLKNQIAELEKTIYEKPKSPEATKAEAELFVQKQNLNTLLQSLEQNYPLYFKLKYNTKLADVKQVQAKLPPATAMLEYFVGDSALYIFSISAQALQVQRIAKPGDFESSIQTLRQALTNAELRFLKKDLSAFALSAGKLYDYLLAQALAKLPPGIQHLIIVPDGSLNYVPFEILGKATRANDFQSYPYLLKNYSISYAVSANLWLEQVKTSNGPSAAAALDLFAGFAPSYNHSDTLSSVNSRTRSLLVRAEEYDIPGAAQEVKEIAQLLEGKTWLGDAATKNQFKTQSPHFRVLHLAMHSIMDDVNPLFSRLLFTQKQHEIEGNDLYANDLYNMRLPAEMVVLSACNTGNGKLRRGEGVMSLSRAFTYTGVPSTVMSLWKAPDESTRTLMLAFYQNLKMGMSKDVALQKAKLSQLASSNASSTNPFFWAGFVASGDMRPLFAR
jgi:CHAT domain-containing protein